MNKNIIILIISVALISLFKTTDLGFSFWKTPEINTKYIHTPNIPVSINTDISIFGLFANFFTELDVKSAKEEKIVSSLDFSKPELIIHSEVIEEVFPITKQDVKLPTPLPEVIEIIEDEKEDIEQIINRNEVVVSELVEEDSVGVVNTEIISPPVVEKVEVVNKVKKKEVNNTEVTERVVDDWHPAKTDKEIIEENPNIKENAKRLILKALENEEISIEDVQELLSEHTSNRKKVKKGDVKDMIKKNKKRN
ncbi:MAG: hypothetical protein HOL74_01615 [Flavobacteriales bacterium]|jgi:hypothetical protein|nr:hypothetical protein [Flavobacteriales bacterium]